MPTFDFTSGMPAGAALTRASTGWYIGTGPALVSAAANGARLPLDPITASPLGLLNEAASTNGFVNVVLAGGVAGTPGTGPNFWTLSGNVGTLVRTLAFGTENGIPYMDLRLAGTTAGSGLYGFQAGAPAVQGETWNCSHYIRYPVAPVGVHTISHGPQERDSGGSPLVSDFVTIVPTSAALASQRYERTRQLSAATTAFVRGGFFINWTGIVTLDVTLRVGLAQVEKASAASSPIVTNGTVTFTRAADFLTLNLEQGIYEIDVVRGSGKTTYRAQSVMSGGQWTVPNDPSPVLSVSATKGDPTFDFSSGTLPSGVIQTRASAAWYFGDAGAPKLKSAVADEARWAVGRTSGTLLGLLNEPAVTQGIRNGTGTGGAAGTPGTNPTNWDVRTISGVIKSIVGTGTEDGIPYVDVRWNGPPSAQNLIQVYFETQTQIVAAQGETWTGTMFMRLMAGTVPQAEGIKQVVRSNTAAGNQLEYLEYQRYPTFAPLRTQRFDVTFTLPNATTGCVNTSLIINCDPALDPVVDFTLRIGLPQLKREPVPSTPVVTTSAALTRAADITRVALGNGTYDITVERVSGTTAYAGQAVTGGQWTVPNDLSALVKVVARMTAGPAYDLSSGTLPAGATLVRPSIGWYWENSNWNRNWSASGAVPGSPGTVPTGWIAASTQNNVTRTIVGTGTEDGIPYIDIQYAGTPSISGSPVIQPAGNLDNPTIPGDTWTSTMYMRLMAGSLTNIAVLHVLRERLTGGGSSSVSSTPLTPTNAPLITQKSVFVRTVSNPPSLYINGYFQINYTLNLPFDVTLRYGAPTLTTASIPYVPRIASANNNVPRWTCNPTTGVIEGLLNEPSETNTIRNSTAGGATSGLNGTMPTNWRIGGAIGTVTRNNATINDFEDGIPYIDFLFGGTVSSSAFTIEFDGRFPADGGPAAAAGQTWRSSVYLRLIAGSMNNTSMTFILNEQNSVGSSLGAATSPVLSPTNAPLKTQRLDLTWLFANAGTIGVNTIIRIGTPTNGAPLNFTLRVGLPQLWQDTIATTPIITSTVIYTRAADVLTVPVPNGLYDLTTKRLSGTTVTRGVEIVNGSYVVPNDPSPVVSISFALNEPYAGLATPVVVVAFSSNVYAGPTTPRLMVPTATALAGPATPIMIVTGRPMLPGPATPMIEVTGRPMLPGPAIPVV